MAKRVAKKPEAKRTKTSSEQRKKSAPSKKVTPLKHRKKFPRLTWKGIFALAALPFVRVYRRLRSKRATATHKTFVLTRQRDIPKSSKIEGYVVFARKTFKTIWQNKRVFAPFLLVYTVASLALFGVVQGSAFRSVNETLDTINQEESVIDPLTRGVIVATSSLVGSLNSGLSEIQQLYMSVVYVFAALVVVWLLRNLLAGNEVKLRDGIYNAGAPIVPVYSLLVVGVLQALPAAVAVFIYVTVNATGVLNGGIESAMFAAALFLTIVVTLYFMTTTLFALMVVTVQGTYPLRAYSLARRIILGQRMRVLFRLVWMLAIVATLWFLVVVPSVVVVNAVQLNNSVIVPLVVQGMTGFSILYASTYCYLLYRRMIDDPAQ